MNNSTIKRTTEHEIQTGNTTQQVKSLLDYVSKHEVKDGSYEVKVLGYKEMPATERSDGHIAVTISIDRTTITDRWYVARIEWIMKDLKAQFNKEYEDISAGALLEHCKKNSFTVQISRDVKYGIQVNYTKVEPAA